MNIRRAQDEDAPEIFRLIEEIYASTDFMCDDFSARYPSEEALARELAEATLFLVAEDQGRAVGYLALERRGCSKLAHTADLTMGVRPAAAGRGVGRALVTAAIEYARTLRLEILYLNVRADNAAAHGLYLSTGFEEIARLTRDIKSGGRYHHGLLMRLFL